MGLDHTLSVDDSSPKVIIWGNVESPTHQPPCSKLNISTGFFLGNKGKQTNNNSFTCKMMLCSVSKQVVLTLPWSDIRPFEQKWSDFGRI